eukprot:14166156-Alexandrium_andersonii.AAC.1
MLEPGKQQRPELRIQSVKRAWSRRAALQDPARVCKAGAPDPRLVKMRRKLRAGKRVPSKGPRRHAGLQ